MSHEQLPKLALTPGEPAGVGPDIVLSIAAHDIPARLVCIADPNVIAERAAALGFPLDIVECRTLSAIPAHQPGTLCVYPIGVAYPVTAGKLDARNARYVLDCLDLAIAAGCRMDIDAIVTGPVHKGIINDAGYAFTGHTEYLARAFESAPVPVMMLVSGPLRVALATTHVSLRRVPDMLNVNGIVHTIEVVGAALKRYFGIASPRIGVCGLNPHAGENGHFGNEDRDVIAVAIARARDGEVSVCGPMPADSAFTPEIRASIDAYITMYHDQGLPVIKALGFGETVNITLGLPILRTSVDHGTATDLAGRGGARADSLLAAVRAAIELSTRSER